MNGFAQVGGLVRCCGRQLLVPLQEPAVGFLGIGAHLAEDLGPVGGAHRITDLVRWAGVRRLAARGDQEQLVAGVEVGQHVRHHDHHAAGVGQLAQHRHDLVVQRRIQTRRRLVEDQQGRPGEQLECDRGPFALTTGQLVDPGIGVFGQVEFVDYLGDDLGAVGFCGVGRQPQFGGVAQRLVNRELAVHDVVLGNHADPAAQRRVFGVDVVALEGDRAGARRGVAGDQPGQRALSGS